ncbi:hypothetical protein C1645_827018 [Glomus cerebriforme]|uniref:MACPF-like domain-containing protein n=1 Tax=Glomus cerebriforme TaxID=658196 RepID=A0A397SVI2_9GLOM|nr:hypothetical protein C1645_827018 [Glomus cerebriforme]
MSLKKIIVFIKVIGDSSLQRSPIRKLNPEDCLSNIRKELENNDSINDMLLFSKKENDEFGEIDRKEEENFNLKEIITINDDRNILYLKRLTWKFLSSQCKLNFGRTMSFDEIKTAKKPAFEMKSCEFNLTGVEKYKKGRLEFESEEDWMKKTNLFFNANISLQNIIGLGSSIGRSKDRNFKDEINSTYKEVGKASLKFNKENLVLTDDFKNDVINAIQSGDNRKFREITEEYGQFISTEVILGGRIYFRDDTISLANKVDESKEGSVNINVGSHVKLGSNSSDSKKKSSFYSFDHMRLIGGAHPRGEGFDEKTWIESLKDYQNWRCIEFRNPISIFQFLPDDLRPDLLN